MKKFSLVIVDIKKETTDTITLVFKQPTLKKIRYLAGQYITLILKINGRRYLRPYSLSSNPSVDNNLEVTVKRIKDGVVSNYIHDFVKVGDTIEVLDAMGNFTLNEVPIECRVFLWAAGSGITPIYSILKEILNKRPNLDPVLIYGSRELSSTIFLTNLLEHQAEFKFPVELFLSIEDVKSHHFGRIDLKFIENKFGSDMQNAAHFICGPTLLRKELINYLESKGVFSDLIFFEDFEVVIDPAFFDDIDDQEISLNFNGESFKVLVPKGKSILEASLDQNIDLPYSCQTGDCSTCKARLDFGKIKMTNIAQSRTDLGEHECLLCSSFPLTSDIKLEVTETI